MNNLSLRSRHLGFLSFLDTSNSCVLSYQKKKCRKKISVFSFCILFFITTIELDKLYRDYFSLIEDKNIWQLMNVHYKGGQEKFEKDIQEEIEEQRLLFDQKHQDKFSQDIENTQERKRGLRR